MSKPFGGLGGRLYGFRCLKSSPAEPGNAHRKTSQPSPEICHYRLHGRGNGRGPNVGATADMAVGGKRSSWVDLCH